MITILMLKGYEGRFGIATLDCGEHIEMLNDDEADYPLGRGGPNYLMPAIRYGADWCEYPDNNFRVVIFRIHTDDDYELPEIVAKF